MEQKQKEELLEIIEGNARSNYEDMVTAKANIDTIAKSVMEIYAISPAHFKKLVKISYENSIEIERKKFSEIDDLYAELYETGNKVAEDFKEFVNEKPV